MTATETIATRCTHCGESCEDSPIHLEDKPFCCEGCKLVYEILQENGLGNYYRIENRPGVSQLKRTKEEYAYLDDAEIQSKLIDYQDKHLTKVRFYLPDIHCSSCIWLLENLYRLHPAIQQSEVNFLNRTLSVRYSTEETSLRKVVELLASIGYAPSLQLAQVDEPKTPAVSRLLYYQLGLAGFAFGNIMLFSFPEYLGLEDAKFTQFFSYLSLALAIPVMVFSGRHYVQSSYLALKNRSLNLDVPLALGMFALFFRSAYEILSGTGVGYLDSFSGLVFFLLIGRWFQQKTYHHLSFERNYRSYFPIAVQVKADGKLQQKALQKLEIGDIIFIKNEEIIPVDAILLKGRARIDYSFVTGESAPIEKKPGEKVYAGGKQLGERIELRVCKKVEQSYLIQLWNHQTFQQKEESSTRLATLIGRWFTYAILVIAAAVLIYWIPRDSGIAIHAFTSVLIVACPCAVALSIPFTYGNVLRILARYQFYVKNVQVIERLQHLTDIVFDKTGTLTETTHKKLQFIGTPLTQEQQQLIKSLVIHSSHPLSQSINHYFDTVEALEDVQDYEEIKGKGIAAIINGQHLRLGAADFMLDINNTIQTPEKGVYVERNQELLGYFQLRPTYRTGLYNLLKVLKGKYQLHLLSGDTDAERQQLQPYFGEASQLHFQQSPTDKLHFIEQLQQQQRSVLMVGDGLNDAGALQQSDVGLVITEQLNNFSPACDAILAAEELERLPQFIRYARAAQWIVFASYSLALIYNVIGLGFAVQGLLSPVIAAILMPLSSVTIVTFGVGMSKLMEYRILSPGKPKAEG